MQTKREKLLVKPWLERRYLSHRKKVQSAAPAIDNAPPLFREHVFTKPKMSQKETDRSAKIARDNLKVLQKLSYIMRSNKVDNHWETPPPNFLSRVRIYEMDRSSSTSCASLSSDGLEKKLSLRRSVCRACSPSKPSPPKIPEDRVPWKPPKLPAPRRSCTLPSVSSVRAFEATPKSAPEVASKTPEKSGLPEGRKKNRISFTTQDFRIILNFPSDIILRMREGRTGKVLK